MLLLNHCFSFFFSNHCDSKVLDAKFYPTPIYFLSYLNMILDIIEYQLR